MAQPNQALLTVTKARLYQSIRQRFHNDTEDQLFDDFDEALPSERERQIDALFSNTINQIIVGYAFRSKLLSLTGGTSFGPALNNLRQYDYLSVRQKRRLCNRISRIKTVYENWDIITHNLTNPRMIHVEARKFLIEQLARSVSFQWVNDYNEKHAPQRKRKNAINPEYPEHMIAEIMASIRQSGIVRHVNGDPDQLRLIGRDLVDNMSNMN